MKIMVRVTVTANTQNPQRPLVAELMLFYLQDFAKRLVRADRASLFLVDSTTNELYARIFDTGSSIHDAGPCSKEIRWSSAAVSH